MNRRPFAVVLTCALLALLIADGADFFFRTPYYESWDFAANSLAIGRAKHFAELYGPYSRWGFHHPGPAYFYALALGEWLFFDVLRLTPAPYNAQALTQLCISMAFYGAALAVFARRLPRRAGGWFWPLAVMLGAVYFGSASGLPSYDFIRGPSAFTSTWSAHEIVLPLLCLLAAGASVAAGDGRDLPLLAVAAGTLLHLHVAQPLFVGPLCLLAGSGLAASGRWRAFRGRCLTAGIILAVFALPFALDFFRGADSNFAAILHHLRTHHGERHSFVKSLLFFLQFGTAAPYQPDRLDFGRFGGPGALAYLRGHALVYVGWSLIALVVAAVALRPWLQARRHAPPGPDPRGLGRFLTWAGVFLLAAVVLTLVWGIVQDGEMFYYNSWLNFAVYYFALLIAVANFAASRAARPRPVGARRMFLDLGERFAPAALAAVVCLSLADRWRIGDAAPETTALLHESIRRVLAAPHADSAGRPAAFEFPSEEWPVAVAVALEMERAGRRYEVGERWAGEFGGAHAGHLTPDRRRAWVPWQFQAGPGAVPWRSDAPETLVPTTRRLRERLAARAAPPDGSDFPLPDDTHLSTGLPTVSPRVNQPREIDFQRGGDAFHYQEAGWSDAEPWGTWSDGPVSSLHFAVLDSRASDWSEAVEMIVYLHPFVSPAAGRISQRIRVRLDGEPLSPEQVATADTSRLTWTIQEDRWDNVARSTVGAVLEFELPDAASPAALDPTGRETDARRLGIGVSRIVFRAVAPPR